MCSLASCPSEIIALIIDELAVSGRGPWTNLKRDLKSCSRASKIFLPHCRKHIFHSITLEPSGSRAKNGGSTRRFCHLVEKTPEIASYVRKLQYTLSRGDYRDHRLLILLQKMTRIVDFGLWADLERLVTLFSLPYGLRSALLAIVYGPHLRRLHISGYIFPITTFVNCSRLEELCLDNMAVDVYDGNDIPFMYTPRRSIPPLKLKSLDCRTLCEFPLLELLDTTWGHLPIVDFTQLENLSIRLESDEEYGLCSRLLQGAGKLKSLSCFLDMERTLPFGSLNPTSYATLVALNLELLHEIDSDNASLSTNLDPYCGLCDMLGLFTHLEELKIKICLSNDFQRTGLGDQWGRLDKMSTQEGYDHLKRVNIHITVWVYEDQDPEDGYALMEKLQEQLPRQQFFRMRAKKGLKFRYSVEVEMLHEIVI